VRDRRILWIRRVVFIFISVLLIRAFQLQMIRGSTYRSQSEQNHIRQIPINPPRGLITDRNGKILAENRPAYSLFIIPYDFKQNPTDSTTLYNILHLFPSTIEKKIKEAGNHPFLPIRIIRDMDFAMLARFEENRLDLPGFYYEVEALRTYTSGSFAAHVLGYVGEVDPKTLGAGDCPYRYSDLVGKVGVEKQYNHTLWGKRGYRYVEVDVRGRQVGYFDGARDVSPEPGEDIQLTLDYALQLLAEKLLLNKVGALVAMNPQNGEILALASKPDYKPEVFTLSLSHSQWDSLRSHPQNPLLHRAIQAQLPPGSTFKLVTGAAALKEKTIQPDDSIHCFGSYQLGRRIFDCWRPEGHGLVNFSDALKVSCNVCFYQMNLKTGLGPWASMAVLWGFGKPTQIDLPGEAKGILPTQSYLDEKYGARKWSKGMLLNLAVGQGDILVTPLQMVQMATIISQKGNCPVPHVVRAVQRLSGGNKNPRANSLRITPSLSQENFQLIQEGMYRAVNEEGGTGVAAWVPRISFCGKTGTAENPRGEPHSWFIGFGPRENPIIAIAVMIEHGGSGGGEAASIAGKFLRKYFENQATF